MGQMLCHSRSRDLIQLKCIPCAICGETDNGQGFITEFFSFPPLNIIPPMNFVYIMPHLSKKQWYHNLSPQLGLCFFPITSMELYFNHLSTITYNTFNKYYGMHDAHCICKIYMRALRCNRTLHVSVICILPRHTHKMSAFSVHRFCVTQN
jgi:hypothetical protein